MENKQVKELMSILDEIEMNIDLISFWIGETKAKQLKIVKC